MPKNMKFQGSRLCKSAIGYGQYKCVGCKRKIQTYCKCSPGVIYCSEHYAKHILEVNIWVFLLLTNSVPQLLRFVAFLLRFLNLKSSTKVVRQNGTSKTSVLCPF
jgi:hypothetical protein